MGAIAFGPIEIVILLLLGGGGLGWPLGVPPLPVDAKIEHAMPGKVLFFAYSAGYGTPDPKSANNTEQLLAEPEVADFFKQLSTQGYSVIEQLMKRGAPDASDVSGIKAEVALCRLALERPWGLYVSRCDFVGPEKPPLVEGGLVIHCGPRAEEFRKLLAKIETEEGPILKNAKTVEIAGSKFRQLVDEVTTTWGMQDEYLLIALGDEMEKLVGRLKESGPAPNWLVKLKKEVAPSG